MTTTAPILARQAADKTAVLLPTMTAVRNWPSVLGAYGAARLRRKPSGQAMVFRFRDGTILECLADPLVVLPVFEVLVSDAYRTGTLRRLGPAGPVSLIDIGAHIGSATIALAKALSPESIISVEPSPISVGLLRRNVERNGLAAEVVEAAVGGATGGWLDLVEEVPGSWENTTVACAGEEPRTGHVRVPVIGLTDLVARAGNRTVVVKMDCEGAEYDIVRGTPESEWSRVWALLLEYHPVEGPGGWNSLLEEFTRVGLRLLWHAPNKSRPGLGTACLVRMP